MSTIRYGNQGVRALTADALVLDAMYAAHLVLHVVGVASYHQHASRPGPAGACSTTELLSRSKVTSQSLHPRGLRYARPGTSQARPSRDRYRLTANGHA